MEPICCDSRGAFKCAQITEEVVVDKSLLTQLPTEVVVVIWSFLDIKSLLRSSLICKSLLDLSRGTIFI